MSCSSPHCHLIGRSVSSQPETSTSHSWQPYRKKLPKLFLEGTVINHFMSMDRVKRKSFIFDSISDPCAVSVVLYRWGTYTRHLPKIVTLIRQHKKEFRLNYNSRDRSLRRFLMCLQNNLITLMLVIAYKLKL